MNRVPSILNMIVGIFFVMILSDYYFELESFNMPIYGYFIAMTMTFISGYFSSLQRDVIDVEFNKERENFAQKIKEAKIQTHRESDQVKIQELSSKITNLEDSRSTLRSNLLETQLNLKQVSGALNESVAELNQYKSENPPLLQLSLCEILDYALVNKGKTLSKLIKETKGDAAQGFADTKNRLDNLVYLLKGVVPSGTNVNDYTKQQHIAVKVWGMCSEIGKATPGYRTDWQTLSPGSGSGGEVEVKGKDPKMEAKYQEPGIGF